jgi:hypothetical protein
MTAKTDPCVNFPWFKDRLLIQKALKGGIPKRIRVAVVLFKIPALPEEEV